MDFDADDARQYVENADYPANKEDLVSSAESNGAPEELIERLQTLSTPEFSDPDAVVRELRSAPTSG
ncbi:MAG: DUF2795 domain-containing protein [Actinomycetota bacterium]|nr:DUF2795 domain-containing protein [Actinomycetota bacterium]HZY65620.1 DUF2795 domain-containing protein [Rubrobacteraceae bacterium]